MPDANPHIAREHADPGVLAYLDPRPLLLPAVADATEAAMNPYGAANSQNAAGTSENVALHVAVIVAFAMVGVYLLRASDFKFVVAGSVG